MRLQKSYKLFFLFLLFMMAGGVNLSAENIRIITPYLGGITNNYEDESRNLDLEDSSFMKGLYLQQVNPDLYQANLFVYQVSDVNYSNLWGAHGIFDFYYDVKKQTKNVIGAGFEWMSLDMDAGSEIPPLSEFELTNNINIFYMRLGRYFTFGPSHVKFSAMPWLGTELDLVQGDVSFLPQFSPTKVTSEIEGDTVLAISGLNLKVLLYHIWELNIKYSAAFDADDYYNRFKLMSNIYLSRHWALSYRYHYSETSYGPTSYHLGGVTYVF